MFARMTSPLRDRAPVRAEPEASPWWVPHVHADRRPFLLARNRIVKALRSHFDEEGFVEVETAALQVSPGNETHLHAFATDLVTTQASRSRLFLHTSPEFCAKKLLAAGEEKIFSLARVFRNRERTALHHPEFTMLEWYRAGASYEALMDDCAAILRVAATAAGEATMRHRGRIADPSAAPERLTVAEAFSRHAGIDLEPLLAANTEAADPTGFATAATGIGVRVSRDDTWSDIFSRVMSERIEPRLGLGHGTILYDYPASEAALARRKPSDPRLAERFELYACGVELANAFGELTDAEEQRRRFKADMDEKERLYGERYPMDEDFLAALDAMPEASGAALGVERLVMLATGAHHIEQVIWTPSPLQGT
jgi:elongation factor P--(R)-beta-lysine ligase